MVTLYTENNLFRSFVFYSNHPTHFGYFTLWRSMRKPETHNLKNIHSLALAAIWSSIENFVTWNLFQQQLAHISLVYLSFDSNDLSYHKLFLFIISNIFVSFEYCFRICSTSRLALIVINLIGMLQFFQTISHAFHITVSDIWD